MQKCKRVSVFHDNATYVVQKSRLFWPSYAKLLAEAVMIMLLSGSFNLFLTLYLTRGKTADVFQRQLA